MQNGLVAWEKTLGDLFHAAEYNTAIFGKWHIGDAKGRWPTDHGFQEWYGIPASYGESLWASDPWYKGDPEHPETSRDPIAFVVESRQGEEPKHLMQLTLDVRRDIDVEYLKRAKQFIKRSVEEQKPFFLYFNHSMMHMPTIPRLEFKGKTGNGDWADCLLELDSDFGQLMAFLDEMGLRDNTIVVFSGDNGPEEMEISRGDGGPYVGSYFTGMEASLRTPAMIRYPNHVKTEQASDEIVHITDMFTTLLLWTHQAVPEDRVIDGVDQRAFFEGNQTHSNRDGFPYWMGEKLYGVKWRNFKVRLVLQNTLTDPALDLPTPHIINLMTDPKERKPMEFPYLHTWVLSHAANMRAAFQKSLICESLIPPNAPLNFVPKKSESCPNKEPR
jgi:arylsulfatase